MRGSLFSGHRTRTNQRSDLPLPPPTLIGSLPPRPDHARRMAHMRARAAFMLGDATWADELYAYYADLSLDPEDDEFDNNDPLAEPEPEPDDDDEYDEGEGEYDDD